MEGAVTHAGTTAVKEKIRSVTNTSIFIFIYISENQDVVNLNF